MAAYEDCDFVFKVRDFAVVLIGDSSVGKTNLLSRYTRNEFHSESTTTIGVEFAGRDVRVKDGARVKAQMWDTAGQEKYRAIAAAFYRGAVGAALVFDLTNRASLKSCERWLTELKDNAAEDIVVMLFGNKADKTDERVISPGEAYAFAELHDVAYVETSAATGKGVEVAFATLIQEIYNVQSKKKNRGSGSGAAPPPRRTIDSVVLTPSPVVPKKGCCS